MSIQKTGNFSIKIGKWDFFLYQNLKWKLEKL